MEGIEGSLALQPIVHKNFSQEEFERIYPVPPMIEPPEFPGRGPYIEPGTTAMGKIRIRNNDIAPALALAYPRTSNILVLEGKDRKLSRIIHDDYELSDAITDGIRHPAKGLLRLGVESVGSTGDALASMTEKTYCLLTSVLDITKGDAMGYEFSKLIKIAGTDDARIKNIQKEYESVPLILCEPKHNDVFAVFAKTDPPTHPVHVFPYTSANYAAAIKHFLGMKPHPAAVFSELMREKDD